MAQQLVAWLREEGYVDCSLPSDAVLDLAKKAFLAAVVWRDGTRTAGVPQEHLNAVVGYELHERGICAAQRKVARAHHRGKTYEEEIEEEWELEACRCPRTTAGLDVLAVRSVLSPDAKYLFRAPHETDWSMYLRAGEVLASLPDAAGSVFAQLEKLDEAVRACAVGQRASCGWGEVSWVMERGQDKLTADDIKMMRRAR